ncbi:3-oxoacyl-ACP reductase [Raineyella sp. LH-20]|uniref:3-oxoacyl-ACP reductase n=1 Tax=Raineyella sp. LH-20 TaxID=3081204 RepID=UPI00295535B1|nr:3-oxoacyl-ACP reductase [Raineyella sp. LH-20]WOP18784.1 3-oxoacyl-ACP reductase [Raineyella sp. LH-20]
MSAKPSSTRHATPGPRAADALLEGLLASPLGHALTRQLGFPEGPTLRRGPARPTGPVAYAVVGGTLGDGPEHGAGAGSGPGDGPAAGTTTGTSTGTSGGTTAATLAVLGITTIDPLRDDPAERTTGPDGKPQPPAYATDLGAVVLDLSGVRTIAALEDVRAVLRPAVRALERSGRVVLVGPRAEDVDGLEAKAVARSLDGLNRSVAKELRGGATSNLIRLAAGAGPDDLRSTLDFLLSGRSAFVSGQSWEVGPRRTPPAPQAAETTTGTLPSAGVRRIVVVTGAARGIGADIARTFHRVGATVVAVDVPRAGESLGAVANEVHGTALQLDITAPDAGERIAAHVAERYGADARIQAIAHNAGITRDRLLANMDEKRWGQVLDVNLAAQLRINAVLLDPDLPGGYAEDVHIVASSSTSGIAGNRGQTNYGTSKAGVIGVVMALCEAYADRPLTVNAVAPGFIETDMTAVIPTLQKEIFRRTNSLHQGGRPIDVAETIVYLADPATSGVNGQVVRVCGQNIVGA